MMCVGTIWIYAVRQRHGSLSRPGAPAAPDPRPVGWRRCQEMSA